MSSTEQTFEEALSEFLALHISREELLAAHTKAQEQAVREAEIWGAIRELEYMNPKQSILYAHSDGARYFTPRERLAVLRALSQPQEQQ